MENEEMFMNRRPEEIPLDEPLEVESGHRPVFCRAGRSGAVVAMLWDLGHAGGGEVLKTSMGWGVCPE